MGKKDKKLSAADGVANAFLLNQLFSVGIDENDNYIISSFDDGSKLDDLVPVIARKIVEDYHSCGTFSVGFVSQLTQLILGVVFSDTSLRASFESYYLRCAAKISDEEMFMLKTKYEDLLPITAEVRKKGLLQLIASQPEKIQWQICNSLRGKLRRNSAHKP